MPGKKKEQKAHRKSGRVPYGDGGIGGKAVHTEWTRRLNIWT